MSGGINQIALSVEDLEQSLAFYQGLFGFTPSGRTRLFRGPIAERIQGLPGAASECAWLTCGLPFFQFEFFRFERPVPCRAPGAPSAQAQGYRRVVVAVRDLDAVLRQVDPALLIEAPVSGKARALIHDPNGVELELVQAPMRLHSDQAARPIGIRVNVASLADAHRLFGEALGFAALAPQRTKTSTRRVFRRGLIDVEAVQWQAPPMQPRAADHRLSDIGFLNVAVGFRSRAAFGQTYRAALATGCRPNCAPVDFGGVRVVYVNDVEALSVELLQVAPWADAMTGFAPPPTMLKQAMRGLDRLIRHRR